MINNLGAHGNMCTWIPMSVNHLFIEPRHAPQLYAILITYASQSPQPSFPK